jgi:multiple sugar transport system ATP-binding protein
LASIELKNVWKKYGKVIAVENVSWKCEDGEFFSILGPSGCGKSSTLRMVAGLEEITSGEIYFDDRVINDLPPRERNVAMVFETWSLYPNLSVYENIAFPLRIRNLPPAEVDRKVQWAARFLDLEGVLNSGVTGLSGGQKQRVSIGRAVVRQPAVMLMDEPISHLDAGLRARMREELEDLARSLGVTTLYITHDQVESMAMADRIAVMNLGKIQQIGTPREIYERPRTEFVAGFIGEPPMNFADCELVREDGRFFLHSPSFRIELSPQKEKVASYQGAPQLELGIRPEDVEVGLSPAEDTVGAAVDFVEPQGERTVLGVKLAGGEIFLIEAAPDFRPEIGATVHLRFDLDHAHIFETQTEMKMNILY